MRLWLGADRDNGLSAPQLTQQMMQWLGEQGVRLLSLVFNGKTVYRAQSGISADHAPEMPGARTHTAPFAENNLATYFYRQEA